MFTASKLIGEAYGGNDNHAVIFGLEKIRKEASFIALVLPQETPYVLLKSVKLEYLFTDLGLIMSSGDSSVGTKRLARRFFWFETRVTGVMFETAGYGVTDFDCEIKFNLGNEVISIDVKKHEDPLARVIVAILSDLSRTQSRNAQRLRLAEATLTRSVFNSERINGGPEERANIVALLDEFNPESYAVAFLPHLPQK